MTQETYSVFKDYEKKLIVLGATIASLFSPLSSSIYLPTLNTLAQDLHVSNSLINLTVTTYLIFQGLAPAFIGGFSDGAGRRPAYLICFIVFLAANIGLALQNHYAALLVLRCVQSSGSSGTVALANAVVADIATSAERGIYIGWASVGSLLGPSVAPIIGGLLSQYLGWEWIFWFLAILTAAFLLPFLLFFPETCREVVGNGSIPAPAFNMSLVSFVVARKRTRLGASRLLAQRDARTQNRRLRFPNPLATLVIVFDKEACLILFSNGIPYACYYVVATISLAYIPIGVGGILSAFLNGKLVDWNFRRNARHLGLPVVKHRQQDLDQFPIEKARLEVIIPLLWVGSASMIAFGWTLHFETSLAGPLVCLFIIGFALIAVYDCLSILLVDVYPQSPATATAANNLVRCWLGAGASAATIPMVDALGVGWALTLTALVWVSITPILLALIRFGPEWREKKS